MFVLKPIEFRKLGHSSEMQNDALLHRERVEFRLKSVYRR